MSQDFLTPIMSVKNTPTGFFVCFFLIFAHFHPNISISIDFGQVKAALFEILEFYDQNPWRKNLSKLTTFYPSLQRPHSAMFWYLSKLCWSVQNWITSIHHHHHNHHRLHHHHPCLHLLQFSCFQARLCRSPPALTPDIEDVNIAYHQLLSPQQKPKQAGKPRIYASLKLCWPIELESHVLGKRPKISQIS